MGMVIYFKCLRDEVRHRLRSIIQNGVQNVISDLDKYCIRGTAEVKVIENLMTRIGK